MGFLESNVSCWFCHVESKVSYFKRNSWTCEHCGQYNGFDKDGDYNKSINEMFDDTNNVNVKYCVTNTNATSTSSTNTLCDKCNLNQQRKIEELAKFEPKNEKNFDREYKEEVEKLDQIYALCFNCQRSLNHRIANIDRLVGEHNEQVLAKVKQSKTIKTCNNKLLKPLKNITNNTELPLSKLSSIPTQVKTIKAHTIAGTVPAYTFKESKNKTPKQQMKKSKDRKESVADNVAALRHSQKENQIANAKTVYRLVFGDIFISLCIIATFISDLAHLFHDSEYIKLNKTNKLLFIYDNLSYLLLTCAAVSFGVVLYRPKFNRILMFLGISICASIHLHLIKFESNEEHYVLELLVSFFLCLFLFISLFYNIVQLIAHFKTQQHTQHRTSTCATSNELNKSILSNSGDMTLNESSFVKTPVTNRLLTSKANKLNTPPNNQMTSNDNNFCESPMQIDTSMNDIENTKPALLTQQYDQPFYNSNQQQQQQQQPHQLRSRLPQPKVYFNNRR